MAPVTTQQGRIRVILASFFGWLFAGVQLGVSSIVHHVAAMDLLPTDATEKDFANWFGWLTASFLLGAAGGGYLLGSVGDRMGRKSAMALSIAIYSGCAGLTYFVGSPHQLLLMRFLVGLGVGGMWPNGIALVSEGWPDLSRPMLAGVIGTAANVGIMLFSILTFFFHVTDDHWRWVMLLTSTPILLALVVWIGVPESARWLVAVGETRVPANKPSGEKTLSARREVFRPPYLGITLLGITLGTIPLFGGWGSSNWANAWSSQVGAQKSTVAESPNGDPEAADTSSTQADAPGAGLKSLVMIARSAPGSLASLLGGVFAIWLGRRRFYFFLSIACLLCSQYLFLFSHPERVDFLWATAALGLFSGFYFGWLPLCLPELFPTRIRATGAGVSFNFGRIATVLGIVAGAELLKNYFDGDYARIGQLTSWIYLIGAVAILFAPPMGQQGLKD